MAKVGATSQAKPATKKKGGAKPGERRGGRQKGTPNKVSGELKDMILGALDAAGGIQYLQKQAEASPAAFLSLVGKVLPMTVNANLDGNLTVEITRFGGAK